MTGAPSSMALTLLDGGGCPLVGHIGEMMPLYFLLVRFKIWFRLD